MPNNGAFTLADIDAPKGQFTTADLEAPAIGTPEWGLTQKAPTPTIPNQGLATRRNAMAQPGITPEMRAASPINKGVETGLEAAPTVAGLVTAPVPTVGALAGSYLGGKGAKAVAAALGAGEEGQGLAETGGELAGGLAGGYTGGLLSGPLRTAGLRLLQNAGLANYFAAEPTTGRLIALDKMKQYAQMNEVLGVKGNQIKLSPNGDALIMPGRSAMERTGISPKVMGALSPAERVSRVNAALEEAGGNISRIADDATNRGVTFDVGHGLTKEIGRMVADTDEATEALQTKAAKIASDTARRLGIDDWTHATPNQALELRQNLWDNIAPRYRGPLYGTITGNLKDAVPELVPEDQAYTELKRAHTAAKGLAANTLRHPSPTKFDEMLDLMKKHPVLTGASGLGTLSSIAGGAKELHDLLWGK